MIRPMLLAVCFLACAGGDTCPDPQPVEVGTATTSGDEAVARRLSPQRPSSSGAPAELGGVDRFRVPLDYAPSKGPDDALVTIVTFSDFECPFCRRVQPTLARIEEEYAGRVRFVFRQNPLPFHNNAMPAAQASLETFAQGGSAMFWRLHDQLFAQASLDRATIIRLAEQAGADRTRLDTAMRDERWKSAVETDQALARQLGARGTPNFFINGRNLTGAQPFDRFSAVIDEELRTAAALVQDGVPPHRVYETLTWRGNAGADTPSAGTTAPRRQPDPNAIYNLPVDPNMPSKGPANALVTIVEVADFQCPFCSRASPTIEQVLQQYGNDVRLVWMNNPLAFHQNAMPAAELALEAHRQQGDAGFWAMHDLLFQNQRSLDRASLEQYATQRQLNLRQVRQALDTNRHKPTIEAHQRTVTGLGATGTPSFFINGRNLRGAQPLAEFQRVIDEELIRARELVRNGTRRRDVYQAAIANGATSAQFLNVPTAPSTPTPPAPAANTIYTIPIPRNAPRRGAATRRAQVVIQEFADFECPFCDRARPTVDRILQEYPTVQVVWRDYPLPFHTHAHLAAEAAREVKRQAGDRGFFQYAELLFENRTALERDDLITYARRVRGVNINRFRRALDRRTHQQAVDDDIAAIQTAQARIGTPSFFINGRLLQGAQPFEAFKTAIDEALRNPSP